MCRSIEATIGDKVMNDVLSKFGQTITGKPPDVDLLSIHGI